MIKKFVAWVKALFEPVPISQDSVDEYIAAEQRRRDATARTEVKINSNPAEESLGHKEHAAQVDKVTDDIVAAIHASNKKSAPQRTKPLNERLKEIELPAYAKGKTLPPKAKRQFIKQAKGSSAPARRVDDSPGVGPVNAALYGYGAATILASEDTDSRPVSGDDCRVSHDTTPSYDSPSSDSSSGSSSSCD